MRNTATITAPAAKIMRPEWARPPSIAWRGSWLRSLRSFALESRNTVQSMLIAKIIAKKNAVP